MSKKHVLSSKKRVCAWAEPSEKLGQKRFLSSSLQAKYLAFASQQGDVGHWPLHFTTGFHHLAVWLARASPGRALSHTSRAAFEAPRSVFGSRGHPGRCRNFVKISQDGPQGYQFLDSWSEEWEIERTRTWSCLRQAFQRCWPASTGWYPSAGS